MSDDLRAQLATLTAERDALKARVAELAPTWRPLHTVEVEVATVSEANQREHHHTKAARVKRQREAVTVALWAKVGRLEGPKLLAREGRLLVCLTRLGARRLDDDNATGALKACRDAVAAWLGVDDGPRGPITWHVEQEAHKRYRLRPMVRVEILGPESEAGGQMVLR